MKPPAWLAWARFLRLPNVLTVPGDVLAGAALAGLPLAAQSRTVAGVALAYLFGMALNDVADRKEDGIHRPERPLPAGHLPLAPAKWITLLLACAALYAHPAPEMVFLIATICAYTGIKGAFPLVGSVVMALCRGLAVWIGAGAPRELPPAVAAAIGLWMLFIFGVTRLAEHEGRLSPPSRMVWFFPALFLAGIAALWAFRPGSVWAVLPAALLLAGSVRWVRTLREAGGVRPSHIGALLGLLFPLQATVLFLAESWVAGTVILALFPIMRLATKHVPAS